MVYDVYLQVKRTGRTHAHVPALPGCNWLAETPEDAWQHAADAIHEHLDWLRRYGLPAPILADPAHPRLVQQHKSTAPEGHLIGFFECERQPVNRAEIPGFLTLLDCARTALLSLTQALSPEILAWRRAEKVWSISEVLRHVAGAQRYYLTRIFDPDSIPIQPASRSVWKRLALMQALSLERLQRITDEQLGAVVVDSSGELWSARKVFRRFIEHEREHTHHIQEILDAYSTLKHIEENH
jgi:predicted RNase H-like HicB family nuclease/uncharacterized damage-inducible protein DinB